MCLRLVVHIQEDVHQVAPVDGAVLLMAILRPILQMETMSFRATWLRVTCLADHGLGGTVSAPGIRAGGPSVLVLFLVCLSRKTLQPQLLSLSH